MTYNPDIHKRRSVRLKDYDYKSNGAYFITICTFKKDCLFGDIADGSVQLSEYGRIVEREWTRTHDLRQNVHIDEFVVMPNHFHGILLIDDNDHVGAMRCLARFEKANKRQTNKRATHCGENWATHRIAPTINAGTIGSIVGQFKSIAAKQINRLRNSPGLPIWQRNYYEHIIRSENELHVIRKYIVDNPLKWDLDNENPSNTNFGAKAQNIFT